MKAKVEKKPKKIRKKSVSYKISFSSGSWIVPIGMNGVVWQKCQKIIRERKYRIETKMEQDPNRKKNKKKEKFFIEEAFCTISKNMYKVKITTWYEYRKLDSA